MPDTLATARVLADDQAGENLLLNAQALLVKTGQVLAAAEESGDMRTTLAAIREARATLETLARLGFAEALGTNAPPEVASETPPYWKFIVECVAEEFRYWPTAAIRIADRIKDSGDERLIAMIQESVPESMWGNRDAIVNRAPSEPPWPWMVVQISDLTLTPEP